MRTILESNGAIGLLVIKQQILYKQLQFISVVLRGWVLATQRVVTRAALKICGCTHIFILFYTADKLKIKYVRHSYDVD